MKTTRWVAMTAAVALSALACSKTNKDGGSSTTLDGLPGVEVDTPKGTVVSKNAMGLGVMLKGPGVSLTISQWTDDDPRTIEEAKKKAASFKAKNVKAEKLPDGYLLTYENEGDLGTNYWLMGRRLLGESAYTCGVKSPKQAHVTSGATICKSLKK